MKWDLNNIYSSFESAEFSRDMMTLENKLIDIENWIKANLQTTTGFVDKTKCFIEFKNEIGDLYNKLGSFSYLSLTADTKNNMAGQNFNKILIYEQRIQAVENEFQDWLLKIDNVCNIIHSNEYLKNYVFYLEKLLDSGKHSPSKEESKLYAKMKNVASNAWENLYRTTISNHMVEINIDGKNELLTLQAIQGLSSSNDPKLREKSFSAKTESYAKIVETATWAYNSIKGEQIIEAQLKGYKSVLQMAMKEYNLNEETIYTMIHSIKKYASIIQKGLIHKAKLLGHENDLPFYDIYAPLGKLEKTYSFDEVRSIILDNLKNFDDKMYVVAKKAFSEKWIDAEPRENKRTGGFCINIHSINESRILLTFTGKSDNILQLSHEIGHAYHYECLNTQSSINSNCSLAIMESAAIFTENFLQKRILKLSNEEERLNILNTQLIRDTRLILDIYAYFNFETKVIEKRNDRILSHNELCDLLKDSFYEAYGSSIQKETIDGDMWITLPQLFYSNRPYYMLSYAFGILFTKGLYAQYIQNKQNFVKHFEHFLSISGKCSVETAAAQLNIDITSEEFWMNSLKIVEDEINEFIKASTSKS